MPQCAILTCNNTHRRTKGGNVRYHRFPGDNKTRMRWIELCGKTVSNSSTARVCSHHFSKVCYERDVQHELLGLPSRCRLKKGAVPDINLPDQTLKEEVLPGSAIDILLAVGLVPSQSPQKNFGGLPLDSQKMRIMEDVGEGCMVQPSSPGHAELHPESETTEENGISTEDNQVEKIIEKSEQPENASSVDEETESKDLNATEDNNTDTDLADSADNKRKHDEEISAAKRFKLDINESFHHRNKMFGDYMDMIECDESNTDHLQMQAEILHNQIKTLNDLAREKEMEWNSIIHLKKFKEELLLRIERKKQLSYMNVDKNDVDESQDESQVKASPSRVTLSIPKASQTDKINKFLARTRSSETNGSLDLRQHIKSRPTLDVQSIIADYRQRHPENVPRRGKRIRNNFNGKNRASNVLNFSSMSLGSGSQVKHNNLQDISNELNLILNSMDQSDIPRSAMETGHRIQDSTSFKSMLLQLAKLSQTEENEILQNSIKPPPPYPEVTVHPVASTTPLQNSLLHGILTKTPSRANYKKAFSPTLARLLTAPDQSGNDLKSSLSSHSGSISITEMLSSSKEDDKNEDSNDRLVIDEGKRDERRESDNNSDTGDDVPQCQGCNQKTAQFVCAGCGNQWYCSRDCQVSAWDEHSEVCCG
ncbi:uncharacterized protein LOC123312543 isoform X2 [Coccinella septempunctata]|nr:uncharacterized protein LOC123312543 isoform X2 [Coccinella septempunctata]XP_044752978.1 uncharacterized protein LOC123312543 isoform X2 [Coccinella septempunctata]XP_044752983.1 uncharacterized protein LOC123312543 isoform X2 [Coccinella septempunctata]XP_044752992.1 uncharacterized protein LOC123312543 isoform X2 [Coccinella septempunctata]